MNLYQNNENKMLLSEHAKKIIEEIATELNFKKFRLYVEKDPFSGDNLIGDISRVKIIKTKKETQYEIVNLFVKVALENKSIRKLLPINSFYCNEIKAYTEILPHLLKYQITDGYQSEDIFNTVKFYKAIKDEGKETIVLEDVAFKSFKIYNTRNTLDYEHCEVVLKNLARYHALSFLMREKAPMLFAELSGKVPNKTNYFWSVVSMIEDVSNKILPYLEDQSYRKKLDKFFKNARDKLTVLLQSKSTEPYNVICHGDCWIKNFLFKYQDETVTEVVFIDWQLIRYSSPVIDLAYMLFISTDKPVLDRHFGSFLETYYNTLTENIKRMGGNPEVSYPEEVFKKQVDKNTMFGLLMAFCLLPVILRDNEEEQDSDKSITGVNINENTFDRLSDCIDFCIENNLLS